MNSFNPDRTLSKVNFRRYLTNVHEPARGFSLKSDAILDAQAGMIKDAFPRRQVFREIASRLRLESKI